MCVFMMDMFIRTAVCMFNFDYNSNVSHSGSVLHSVRISTKRKLPKTANFNFVLHLPVSPDFPL